MGALLADPGRRVLTTYGTALLSSLRRLWEIDCEPHVRARLKRVFARAPQAAGVAIRISHTPEHCRDLAWFLQRYPMQISPEDRAALHQGADAHVDTERRLAELLACRVPPLDIQMAEPARAYQATAVQMLEVVDGLLVGDDVGLGKTVTAIAGMVSPTRLPAVVVCPVQIERQWEQQVRRFLPALTVHRCRGGKPYSLMLEPGTHHRKPDLRADKLPDVLILSYHKLRGWADILAELVRYVVFDECQQLRSPETLIADACRALARRASHRMGLSATPIYNYGEEWFHVIDALRQGALGTREEFVREWCTIGGARHARIKDGEEFGAYLRREGIMIRRTRQEVGRELPELQKILHTIDCDLNVINKMVGDAAALARIILQQQESYRGQLRQAAGEFDQLMRQATGIAKAPYVAEFVKLLVESGEKVVLFGWHREVYSIWLERLKHCGAVMYTGTESPVQKAAAIKKFCEDPHTNVLVMSLRSGAGVDGLQGFVRTVVFGELDWSPGVHEQCVGRVHRDGQDDPVVGYFMVSEEGADPSMVEVLGVKKEQIEPVRNPSANLVERIETGEDHIKKMARDLLLRRGETIPEPTDTEVAA